MKNKTALILLAIALVGGSVSAQSPAPMIVQAIVPGATPAPTRPVAAVPAVSDSVLKTLQEIKAANEELLSKQTATLQQLDEMEKAAEQIKIYSKRG